MSTHQVCDELGVPGNPASAYAICRNKHLSRVCLKENGLATPRSALISSADDIPKAMKEVPFPLVVKPTAYVQVDVVHAHAYSPHPTHTRPHYIISHTVL
jgi:carbamoylphosphate synthase large subunit